MSASYVPPAPMLALSKKFILPDSRSTGSYQNRIGWVRDCYRLPVAEMPCCAAPYACHGTSCRWEATQNNLGPHNEAASSLITSVYISFHLGPIPVRCRERENQMR